MTKILLSGCNGKMGKMISQTVTNLKDLEICGGIDKNTDKNFNYPVFNSINDCHLDFHVILDFSRADALDSLLNYAEEKNKPLVLCTTGYSEVTNSYK
ncbi:hypothetical protein [Haloimpatiens lingqiaonensis]|uniref:hypothetical protein n=1 Tax=Haloimpatiens lingqiaonensis TaxID=1380675 RepID=UPI0010FDDE4B|nr:hypothetical protein [Haloimpatiens lingqiaonensis]